LVESDRDARVDGGLSTNHASRHRQLVTLQPPLAPVLPAGESAGADRYPRLRPSLRCCPLVGQLEPPDITDSAPRTGVARWWVSWSRQISHRLRPSFRCCPLVGQLEPPDITQTPPLASVLPAGWSAGAIRYHRLRPSLRCCPLVSQLGPPDITQTPPVAPVLPAGGSAGHA